MNSRGEQGARRVRLGWRGWALAGIGALASAPALAQQYTVMDLGAMGGPQSSAWAINESGQIVGQADRRGGTAGAFVYTPGPMTPPLAQYNCEEGSGATVYDQSGFSNHGSNSGCVWSNEAPIDWGVNFSLLFDNERDAITIPAGPGTNLHMFDALTLEAFIRPTTTSGLRHILWADDGPFELFIRDGRLGLTLNWTSVFSIAFTSTNMWTHVAVTYDQSVARLYLNGVLVASANVSLGPIGPVQSRNIIRIGNDETADFSGFGRGFRGMIDQVRVLDAAVDADEIAFAATHNLGYAGKVDLGQFPGGFSSGATDMNNFNQIVGWAQGSSFGEDYNAAFLYEDGMMVDLGTLGGLNAYAEGINPAGQIVGSADLPPDQFGRSIFHAFRWDPATQQMVDLGVLSGFNHSIAYDINNIAEVVGVSNNGPATNGRATLWRGEQRINLGTLGGNYSTAYAINNHSQVVGQAALSTNFGHAFLWENGVMMDLGTLGGGETTVALGLNSRGEVVGWGYPAGTTEHAFLYRNGRMTDLNDLIPADSGWRLQVAQDINADGRIVGWGSYNGQRRAFLLMPTMDCGAIERFSAGCRRGRLAAKVRSSLPEGTMLTVDNNGQQQTMTINDLGRGKVKWVNQSGSHVVQIMECPGLSQTVTCN